MENSKSQRYFKPPRYATRAYISTLVLLSGQGLICYKNETNQGGRRRCRLSLTLSLSTCSDSERKWGTEMR